MEARYLTNINNDEIYAISGHGKDYRVCIKLEDDSYNVSLWVESVGEWKDFISCRCWKEELLNKLKLILTPKF